MILYVTSTSRTLTGRRVGPPAAHQEKHWAICIGKSPSWLCLRKAHDPFSLKVRVSTRDYWQDLVRKIP